jgi:hypothetical protein
MYFERMIMMIKPEKWRYEEGGSHYVTCSMSTSHRIASTHSSTVLHEAQTLFCHRSVSFDMIQCNSSRIAMASIDVLLTEEKKTIDCEAICLAID